VTHTKMQRREGFASAWRTVQENSRHSSVQHIAKVAPTVAELVPCCLIRHVAPFKRLTTVGPTLVLTNCSSRRLRHEVQKSCKLGILRAPGRICARLRTGV
jgi:hypothetical protein